MHEARAKEDGSHENDPGNDISVKRDNSLFEGSDTPCSTEHAVTAHNVVLDQRCKAALIRKPKEKPSQWTLSKD